MEDRGLPGDAILIGMLRQGNLQHRTAELERIVAALQEEKKRQDEELSDLRGALASSNAALKKVRQELAETQNRFEDASLLRAELKTSRAVEERLESELELLRGVVGDLNRDLARVKEAARTARASLPALSSIRAPRKIPVWTRWVVLAAALTLAALYFSRHHEADQPPAPLPPLPPPTLSSPAAIVSPAPIAVSPAKTPTPPPRHRRVRKSQPAAAHPEQGRPGVQELEKLLAPTPKELDTMLTPPPKRAKSAPTSDELEKLLAPKGP